MRFFFGLLLLSSLAAVSTATATTVELSAIDPSTVEPRAPFTLILKGTGFEPGASVFIESASGGKFLRYRPAVVEPDRIEVALPLGFGTRPAERGVYLVNDDGSRTQTLKLHIGRVVGDPEKMEPVGTDETVPETTMEEAVAVVGTDTEPAPQISELRPSEIPAGKQLIVELFGSGFSPESQVLVTANIHAGSSHVPEYELRAFATYFIDAQLIEVKFDRGFYPIPGARDVVVENPSGSRSEPVVMRVSPNKGNE